jgi:cytoskeletal protein CcmA (bactofilin family)
MRRLPVALVLLCTLVPAAPALAADENYDERIVISGPVIVDRGEEVGDVVVADGDITIRGEVQGDVVAIAGDVTIRGSVSGDVVTVAGKATLGRRARIGGDLVYFDKKPAVTRGARVSGETKKADPEFDDTFGIAAIGFWLAVGLSMLVLGLLLLLLAPRAAIAIGATVKRRWAASIGVGIAVCILLPIIAALACVSILGLPLGVTLLFLLVPLFAIAYCTSAFAVGRLILKNAGIFAFVLGLLILRALALIPIAGGLFSLLAVVFGVGVLFMTLFRARSA